MVTTMVKFVYFDMGGVLIKDFSGGTEKWDAMKKVMGVKSSFEKEFDELYDKYEPELCLTRETDSLIPVFKEKFGMEIPEGFSMLHYFVDHFEANSSIWPVIAKVKEKCGVGIITNMYVDMFDLIEKKGILPPYKWDIVIDSSKVGVRKPDPAIFELAVKKSGINKHEILFVDNGAKHIEAAKKFGLQTFLYDPSDYESASIKLMDLVNKELTI